MKLNNKDLTKLSLLAEKAARKAGIVIQSYINKTVKSSYKEAGNSNASQIVTEVDQHCEAIIIKALSNSLVEYDLALLSEEQEDDRLRLEKDYFWCIDPLDGTLAFIESKEGYAVSIALVSRSGESYIGVVYDPVNEVLYSAIKGLGAYRNGEPWILPKHDSSTTISIPFDRSLIARNDFKTIENQLSSALKEHGYNTILPFHHGGAVMNACWALEQMPSCYFKLPKTEQGGGSLWDFAATSCLYQALNLPALDFFGQALDLNKHSTTFMNESGVIFASSLELVCLTQTAMQEIKNTK